MAAPDLVNLSALIDDAKCFALVRQHRWPEGVSCPACRSRTVVRDGFDETQAHRQRYRCKTCAGRFDDLTGTVLAGHHQPLRVWVLCLYFMGLNLSNRQIARTHPPRGAYRAWVKPAFDLTGVLSSAGTDWRRNAQWRSSPG
jgi:transposase-like protein